MKQFAKFAYLISVLIVVIFVTFCTKPDLTDNLSTPDNTSVASRTGLDDYAMTTNDITVANGMLCFPDTTSFNKTIASLQMLSSDSAYMDNHLRSIGVTPGEPIPINVDIASDPVCQKFNDRFNFYSLREHIDDTKESLLENGVPFDSLPYFFVGNPCLRSVLNQYYEVKIGNLIHKMIDEANTFIITGNDYSLLPLLRAAPDPLAIGQMKNLALINDRAYEDSILYDHIYGQAMIGSGCDFSFETEKIGNKTYKFTNSTKYYGFNGNNANIYWTIKDANGNIMAQTSSHSNSYTYTVPDNLPNSIFPLNITMQHVLPCIGSINQNFVSSVCDEPIILLPSSITARELLVAPNPLTFQFRIDVGTLNGYVVVWNFGDGSPEVAVSNGNFVTHEFPEDFGQRDYNVCATITKGNCWATTCKKFDLGCGYRISSFERSYAIPGTPFRFEARLFIERGVSKFKTNLGAALYFKRGNKNENAKSIRVTYFTPSGTTWLEGCRLVSMPSFPRQGCTSLGGSGCVANYGRDIKPKYVTVRDDMFKARFEVEYINPNTGVTEIASQILKIFRN